MYDASYMTWPDQHHAIDFVQQHKFFKLTAEAHALCAAPGLAPSMYCDGLPAYRAAALTTTTLMAAISSYVQAVHTM
jgi:hypothetical protein